MMKFCDFLDQQKEYKLADTILVKFQKTAMVKTYHSNNISFEKILDLSCKYIEANPNSFFVKTAGPPAQGPSYKDIYKFLKRIGFTDNDFKRDIGIEIVKQKYRMYFRDLTPTVYDTKLYDTVLRTGYDKPDGLRVITPDLRIKLNAIAGLDNITPGSTTQSESKEPPPSSSGSSSKSNSPAPKKSKPETLDPAAMISSENAAGKVAERKNLLITFFNKLKNIFPQLSSKLGLLANSVSKWGNPLIAACFLVPNAYYWITTFNSQGAEALDSWTEKQSFASFISAIFGTISLAVGAASAAPTAGAGAVGGGSIAGIAYGLSAIFSLGSWITQFFENDDPTDKLPKDKPEAGTKPSSKPTTPSKPQSTQPPKPAIKPVNPTDTYGSFN